MYLFGSHLIKKMFSDFREPKDIDWVTNDVTKHKQNKIFIYIK
jgi:ribosomal protein L24E